MSRLSRIVTGVANIAAKDGLGAYDRILMERLRGYGPGYDNSESVINDAYTKVDLVFSCISYTAKAIAQVPLLVVKKGKKGKFNPVDESDPWQMLLDHPNYMTSKVQFVTSVISHLLLDGCVAIIPFPPKFSGNPDSLWVVPWKYCEYKLDNNGHLEQWVYKPRGFEGPKYDLGPGELFQVKFWNPENPMEGLAPIQAGRLPVMELYKSSDYNQRFFDQGAVPGGVLSTPLRLKQADVDLVLTQFKEKHQGWQKRWDPAVLHQDLKWLPTGISQRDMDFVNLRTKSGESIMQIFGMKKVILGITDALNYATGKAQQKEWWSGTCLPLMRLISDTLTYGLFQQSSPTASVKLKDYRINFDISAIEALHEDYAAKIKTAEAMFRMSVPFEEINSMLELGLDPQPWYSLAYVPSQMMCINFDDVGRENPNAPAAPEKPEPAAPADVPVDDPNPTINESIEPRGIEVITEHFTRTRESQVSRFVDENMHPFIKEHVKTLVNKLRRGIFDMRAKTLQNLLKENTSFLEVRRLVDSTDFSMEIDTMKKGVVTSWEEIVNVADWIINNDEQKTAALKEKVDTPDSRAIKTTWLSDFFTEIQKLIDRKKQSVLKIMENSETLEAAATEVRGMFNRSLNEIGPLVKAEVRRIVVLVINTAK